MRFAIFSSNLDRINAHNAKGLSWRMALNAFGDLTPQEFAISQIGGATPRGLRGNTASVGSTVGLPSSVDWTKKGDVAPVKNQGQCGACWAFATVGTIESINAINGHGLVQLSEQQLIDCASAGGGGCDGGELPFDQVYEWVVKNGGLCSEAAYPYNGQDGTCKKSCTPVVKISGYENVKPKDDIAFATAVAQQPVAVAIEADESSFQFYSSGVLDGACGTNLDHNLLCVGYGEESGAQYYKFKNSWGAAWGMEGYVLIARGEKYNSGSGECGIYTMPAYPVQK